MRIDLIFLTGNQSPVNKKVVTLKWKATKPMQTALKVKCSTCTMEKMMTTTTLAKVVAVIQR